jgi:hypothetical protein
VDVCIPSLHFLARSTPTDYLSLMGLNEWKLQGGGRFIEMRPPRLAIKCNLAIYPSLLWIPARAKGKKKKRRVTRINRNAEIIWRYLLVFQNVFVTLALDAHSLRLYERTIYMEQVHHARVEPVAAPGLWKPAFG